MAHIVTVELAIQPVDAELDISSTLAYSCSRSGSQGPSICDGTMRLRVVFNDAERERQHG